MTTSIVIVTALVACALAAPHQNKCQPHQPGCVEPHPEHVHHHHSTHKPEPVYPSYETTTNEHVPEYVPSEPTYIQKPEYVATELGYEAEYETNTDVQETEYSSPEPPYVSDKPKPCSSSFFGLGGQCGPNKEGNFRCEYGLSCSSSGFCGKGPDYDNADSVCPPEQRPNPKDVYLYGIEGKPRSYFDKPAPYTKNYNEDVTPAPASYDARPETYTSQNTRAYQQPTVYVPPSSESYKKNEKPYQTVSYQAESKYEPEMSYNPTINNDVDAPESSHRRSHRYDDYSTSYQKPKKSFWPSFRKKDKKCEGDKKQKCKKSHDKY